MENIITILYVLLAIAVFLFIMVLLRLYVILQIIEGLSRLIHGRALEMDAASKRAAGFAKGSLRTLLRLILILIGRDK